MENLLNKYKEAGNRHKIIEDDKREILLEGVKTSICDFFFRDIEKQIKEAMENKNYKHTEFESYCEYSYHTNSVDYDPDVQKLFPYNHVLTKFVYSLRKRLANMFKVNLTEVEVEHSNYSGSTVRFWFYLSV